MASAAQPLAAPAPNPGDERLLHALKEFMPCQFAPEPARLPGCLADDLRRLGPALLAFYRTQNDIYIDSVNGRLPRWVAQYLDNGKPAEIVKLARAKAFRRDVPPIIRPDILMHAGGYSICELDSVPGGFGLTARLADLYRTAGYTVLGDVSVENGFIKAMLGAAVVDMARIAIVVSDESADYREEMDWLSCRLRDAGHDVHVVHPRDLRYTDEVVFRNTENGKVVFDAVYRFFELFDVENISKWHWLAYLAIGRRVRLAPAPKHHLEEKLWFALFHHPLLQKEWKRRLSEAHHELLTLAIPRTWIMDPTPLPPHAVIPGFSINGTPIQSWSELAGLSQRDRRLVIKPSGFSAEAWGSRGVVVGHDISGEEWASSIERALACFPTTTSIVQEYVSPLRQRMSAYSGDRGFVEDVDGRVRITPYFFVIGGEAILSNVLVTHCSSEKKKIHGMKDAVMTVCAG